tara:strand:+ start:8294 stop:8749 length:456 start_codon:yes stop_codon:yes gene_type:complete
MGTIKKILSNALNAQSNFDSDLKLAVTFVADDLINLQREGQLFQGIGNDGKIIGRYSKATESITQGLTGVGYPKRAGDPFNFYASGSLFKSWSYVFKDNSKLQLIATDRKTNELKERYPTMIGLTVENEHFFNYTLLLNALRQTIARHFIQ